MAEERLTQDEVAAVLRRAAELDVETSPPGDERVPLAAIEAAAAEVGLAPAAVRQAAAELRAGVLAPADGPVACDPHVVVEAAVVPLEVDATLAAVGRWLSAQTFHRHRGRDGVEVWRLREDWLAGLQRKLDFSASVRLKWVREVVVRAVAVEGGTLVRVEAALATAPHAAPAIGAAAAALPGSGIVTLGAMSASPAVVAAGAAVTGVGSLGGWLAGRSVRHGSRARIADELAAALDRLGSGIEERNAFDRLRERARTRRGPWLKA